MDAAYECLRVHLRAITHVADIWRLYYINIQELDVPEAVYYGLEKLLRYRVRAEDIDSEAELKPPFGYIKSPYPFPVEYTSVTEKQKTLLKKGKEGDRPKSLGPLARRMINDYEKTDENRVKTLETGVAESTGTSVAESTAVVPSKIKLVSVQRKRKVDLAD